MITGKPYLNLYMLIVSQKIKVIHMFLSYIVIYLLVKCFKCRGAFDIFVVVVEKNPHSLFKLLNSFKFIK